MSKYLEPCAPYDVGCRYSDAPVSITAILDRLSEHQLRQMAIALSVHGPASFERIIRESSASKK